MFFCAIVNTVLNSEQFNNNYIQNIGACRDPDNFKTNDPRISGGAIALITLSGFIVVLKPVIYRETSSHVIHAINELLCFPIFMEYMQYCMGFGWDFVCCMYFHLITLISNDILTNLQVVFWVLVMVYMFIDRFHIRNHKDDICKFIESIGLFHPKLTRWKSLLNKQNDNVVEQFWVKMNKIYSLKRMCFRKYELTLLLYRDYQNHTILMQYMKKYKTKLWFEPHCNFSPIRNFNLNNNVLQNIANMKHMRKSELKQKLIETCHSYSLDHNNKPKALPQSERISYTKTIEYQYTNVFAKNNETWTVHPLKKYHELIIKKYDDNESIDNTLQYIHEIECGTDCLCSFHYKYIEEILNIYGDSIDNDIEMDDINE